MSSYSRLGVWALLVLVSAGNAGCSEAKGRRSDAGVAGTGAAGGGGAAGSRAATAGRAAAGDSGAAAVERGGSGGAGVAAGEGGAGASGTGGGGAAGVGAAEGWWKPKPGTTWQWQLTGRLDASVDVAAYDIDLFDTPAATIARLHAEGRKVICYMDTAYEPDRPDSGSLEPHRGNPIDGWPGQYWLDVREPAVLEVMKARIARGQEKGCDAIEADDVDARSNDPGFPIRAVEQQAFIRALAEEAHARGMAFGLKNDLEEIEALLDVSDFAINEECFEFDECEALAPFIEAGKAVLHVEYTEGDLAAKANEICPAANRLNFDTLIKRLDLDATRRACR